MASFVRFADPAPSSSSLALAIVEPVEEASVISWIHNLAGSQFILAVTYSDEYKSLLQNIKNVFNGTFSDEFGYIDADNATLATWPKSMGSLLRKGGDGLLGQVSQVHCAAMGIGSNKKNRERALRLALILTNGLQQDIDLDFWEEPQLSQLVDAARASCPGAVRQSVTPVLQLTNRQPVTPVRQPVTPEELLTNRQPVTPARTEQEELTDDAATTRSRRTMRTMLAKRESLEDGALTEWMERDNYDALTDWMDHCHKEQDKVRLDAAPKAPRPPAGPPPDALLASRTMSPSQNETFQVRRFSDHKRRRSEPSTGNQEQPATRPWR